MPIDRPNVLFILSDDQGQWAAGCYGNPEIRTPNLDRIAATGMRFDSFFVATPVCSPSRATLFTGRIPSQHGVHDWLSGGNCGEDAIRFMKGQTAYTDVMAEHGIRCGISGKWHLGDSMTPQFSFDHWYVHEKGGGDYNAATMVRDGRLVPEKGYVTDLITDDALAVLDDYPFDQPFYLSVHYTAPHSPWTGHPQNIVDSYDDCPFESCPQEPRHPWANVSLTERCLGNREMLKGYFAAVTAMDANIGRLLDKLEELGLRENTLVVFLSDNGFSCGHHGFWGKGNGTNPRNMYENSIKVPALFTHPGHIPEGATTDAMVSAYDFMPTLLDYVDLPLPDIGPAPGSSFAPILRGEEVGGRDAVVIFDEYGPVRMARTQDWKYVQRSFGGPDGPDELYDLAGDPDERRNLVDDPAQAQRIGDMRAMIDDWFARYVNPARDGLRRPGDERGQNEYLPPN